MSKAVSVLMPRRSGKFVHEIMRTLELAIRLRELGAENFRLVRKSIGPMSEEQVKKMREKVDAEVARRSAAFDAWFFDKK